MRNWKVLTATDTKGNGVVGCADVSYSTTLLAAKGTSIAQWLRCCATNRKVAGSILDGVIGIFH